MSNSNFPAAVDTLFDPLPTTTFDDRTNPHHLIEGRQNDAITQLELKVGVDSSNDTSSLDWKISNILSGNVTIAPSPHAVTHEAGGTDPLPLDALSAASDNTNLNSSVSAHGLLPKLVNDATKYLDGTGHFSVPAATGGGGGTTYTGVNSVNVTGSTISLKNDSATPGNDAVFGTTSGGTLGWRAAANLPIAWASLTGIPTTFTPAAHQSSHIAGTDPLPSATATNRGLLAQLSGNTGDFVDGTNHCQSLSAVIAGLGVTPTGGMIDFAGSAAPTGWLLCDGTSYPTASFPALFAVIGYNWGGSGANFNVPDMRGRMALGAGQGTGLTNRALAAKGGEEAHVLTIAELAQHNHSASQPDHYHTISGAGNHTHGATLADHQHALPPFAHSHTYVQPLHSPVGSGGQTQGGGTYAYGAENVSTYTSPVLPTYFTSQYGGIPGITVNACGNITPNTTYESQTMGAVGGITVNNNGSSTAHNNMPPFVVTQKLIKT
jgi:microcystin-dependent protein